MSPVEMETAGRERRRVGQRDKVWKQTMWKSDRRNIRSGGAEKIRFGEEIKKIGGIGRGQSLTRGELEEWGDSQCKD